MNGNRNALKRYKITYLDLASGQRRTYMQGTTFNLAEAQHEIKLLKKQQDKYALSAFGRTRARFQKKQIKFK